VWKVIFKESKTSFTPVDYVKYLHELWTCAERLGVEPQMVDFLAWTYWEDREGAGEQAHAPAGRRGLPGERAARR
jgi:hypothetical protein